jgi:hypothetical protein
MIQVKVINRFFNRKKNRRKMIAFPRFLFTSVKYTNVPLENPKVGAKIIKTYFPCLQFSFS